MGTGAGTTVALTLASALTLAIAWPAVRPPTGQIFGHEIVGRHHDPFTVMYQMAGAGAPAPYVQPVTDWTGLLLARALDPVSAYNAVILLTFPLTAAATYALARYLALPHVAALVAALFFAFAPLHVAHAAYHPHIAQTQWLPLYLLALFAMLDRPSRWRALGLAGACAALVLSNFYAGLIGAVITPVALVGYWWAGPRGERRPAALWTTAGLLAALGAAGLAFIGFAHPQVLRDPSVYAFPAADVSLYSARWWAYLVPPVSHAVLGPTAAGVFERAGITVELLEQQVYVGYAILVLAAGAGMAASIGWRTHPGRRPVLVLWGIALTAVLVSVGPPAGSCEPDSWAPACRLHAAAPMFRSYARFAFAAHLALAIGAGAGAALLASWSRAGRILAATLVALAAFEYWPLPGHARDVLPTAGHRWLAGRAPDQRTLDCVPADPTVALVPFLMRRPLHFLDAAVPSCRDPHLGPKLAALGYTHVLIREPDRGALPLVARPEAGLTPLVAFPDSRVYAIAAPVPAVLVIADLGFFEYEHAGEDVWRWMEAQGSWRIRNTTRETRAVGLSMILESVAHARLLEVALDGKAAGSLHVGTTRERHVLGPWSLAPGDHEVTFAAGGRPFRPSEHGLSADDRALTVAFRQRRWMDAVTPHDERPR